MQGGGPHRFDATSIKLARAPHFRSNCPFRNGVFGQMPADEHGHGIFYPRFCFARVLKRQLKSQGEPDQGSPEHGS